ncbi:hypothetical protein XANCAGTX0491_001351 [Xanthoria calcicola]
MNSRKALPPRNALSHRERMQRIGMEPVTTLDEHVPAIHKAGYQTSDVRTRSQRAQMIEVSDDTRPPIYEREAAEKFWNPVTDGKPDWCWVRRENEVMSKEMPVVLAVNDGERPTPDEREESVLSKRNWDLKEKWLHWVIEIDGVLYIANVNKKGEVRRFMGGSGGQFDFLAFAFLIEGNPSRQETSDAEQRLLDAQLLGYQSENLQTPPTTKRDHRPVARRKRRRAIISSPIERDDGKAPEEAEHPRPIVKRRGTYRRNDLLNRTTDHGEDHELSHDSDHELNEEQEERESQLGRGASEEIPFARDEENERVVPESPIQSVTHNDDNDDGSRQEVYHHLDDDEQEPLIQPTKPARSRASELKRLKAKLHKKREELVVLEANKDKAEDEAKTGDSKYRSLRADRAMFLAKARRLEAKANDNEVKAEEVKEEADTRRGEAEEYGEKIRKAKQELETLKASVEATEAGED